LGWRAAFVLWRLLKSSILPLLLGGAVLQHCETGLFSAPALAAEVAIER
jgi:hypothetical protein